MSICDICNKPIFDVAYFIPNIDGKTKQLHFKCLRKMEEADAFNAELRRVQSLPRPIPLKHWSAYKSELEQSTDRDGELPEVPPTPFSSPEKVKGVWEKKE